MSTTLALISLPPPAIQIELFVHLTQVISGCQAHDPDENNLIETRRIANIKSWFTDFTQWYTLNFSFTVCILEDGVHMD